MLLAAQADVFKFVTDLATISAGVITPLGLAWIVYLQLKARSKVEEVKVALSETGASTDKKLDRAIENTNGHLKAMMDKIDSLELALKKSEQETADAKSEKA
jgi:hypothetical protein